MKYVSIALNTAAIILSVFNIAYILGKNKEN